MNKTKLATLPFHLNSSQSAHLASSQPYICSTVFASLTIYAVSIIDDMVLLSSVPLIREIQELHITHNKLVLVLTTTLHQISMRKSHRILYGQVFSTLIQILPQAMISFPFITHLLTVPVSRQYAPPWQLHIFHLDNCTHLDFPLLKIQHVAMNSICNQYLLLFHAVVNRKISRNLPSAMLKLFGPHLSRKVICSDQKSTTRVRYQQLLSIGTL